MDDYNVYKINLTLKTVVFVWTHVIALPFSCWWTIRIREIQTTDFGVALWVNTRILKTIKSYTCTIFYLKNKFRLFSNFIQCTVKYDQVHKHKVLNFFFECITRLPTVLFNTLKTGMNDRLNGFK